MAKAAVRSFMDSFVRNSNASSSIDPVLIITGKGLHSDKDPVLQRAVLSVLSDEYGVNCQVDEANTGRLTVSSEELRGLVARNSW